MMTTIDAIKKDIIEVCNRLYQRNMLAAADGNISYRMADDCILITPSGLAKAFIQPDEIACIRINGDVVYGKPSSEKYLHLAVYQTCPQARCVVHAHPPTAIAWSIAQPNLTELPAGCMSELILAVKRIPFVPYARPGSQDMGSALYPFLPEHRAMILSRHGALTWGESLLEAVNGMERIEHSAQILMYAQQLGGLTYLPEEEVKVLYQMRKQLGEKLL
jgi:L-fuculose-phosphate aldolase